MSDTTLDTETPATDSDWVSADLGQPFVDLEDAEAVRQAMDEDA